MVNAGRRALVGGGALALLPYLCPAVLLAELPVLPLRLVRRTGWEELMGRNRCVIADVYVASQTFPIADPGRKLANALELAWRNNENKISALPRGDYTGSPRTDGDLGWRIELKGTGNRKNIQIHIGNKTAQTVGCILLGTGDSTDSSCFIAGSQPAMQKLQEEYGKDSSRVVVLRIE